MKISSLLLSAAVLMVPATLRAAEPMVVHEWGTFTSLQNEDGNAIARINTDDEPVPAFVHTMSQTELFPATTASVDVGKSLPAGDPEVTMRLETPVLYFHPAKDQSGPVTVDVHVAFRGGWLAQYYPNATAGVRGVAAGTTRPAITPATVGELSWKGLVVNSSQGVMPATKEAVWTSPRAVEAADVSAGSERERFLFYRGVGHLDSPVRVERREGGRMLEVHAVSASVPLEQMWLVDVRGDGSVAFRAEEAANGTVKTAADFSETEYSRDNLRTLKDSMRSELVKQGLFGDEADALLNTWEQSYFQNPGERVFFMVPQRWTDDVLPLTLSVPAQVTRVMVGRVEIVTPAQREVLAKLVKMSATDAAKLQDVSKAMTKLREDPSRAAAYRALAGGHGDLRELGVPVPEAYAQYLSLGRFRTPLLLNMKDGMNSPVAMALKP